MKEETPRINYNNLTQPLRNIRRNRRKYPGGFRDFEEFSDSDLLLINDVIKAALELWPGLRGQEDLTKNINKILNVVGNAKLERSNREGGNTR